jgi:hypothetical protein
MRTVKGVLTFVATIVAAVAIGFGVPLAWIWIGSQLQSDEGASTVSWTVAMVILFGIIFTYVALLYLASWVMGRIENRGDSASARAPWMRGMTEARQRQGSMAGVERVFVVTTLLVTVAFWLWFAFLAGSPIPNQ